VRKLDRSPHIGATTYTRKNAFFQCQLPGGFYRVLISNLDNLIDDVHIQNVRHKSRSDPLYFMGARFAAGQHGGVLGLDRHDFQVLVLFLQDLAAAGEGPARADTRDQHINLAVRIDPNLLGRGLPVDLRIGRVLELLGHKGIRILRHELFGFFDRTGHAAVGGRQNQLGTE